MKGWTIKFVRPFIFLAMAKYTAADNKLFSGTLDNSTYQRNNVVRDWVYPRNTYSDFKQFQIECISNYSRFWQSLTQEQMKLWHNYSYIHHDSFCKQIIVSGVQAFIGINSNYALHADDNSTIHFYTPVNRIRSYDVISKFSIDIDSSSYIISNDANIALTDVAFYSTINLSTGVFKPRRCDFFFCGFVSLDSGFTDVLPKFTARLGISPNTGFKIFARFIPFEITSGTYSTLSQTSNIVT